MARHSKRNEQENNTESGDRNATGRTERHVSRKNSRTSRLHRAVGNQTVQELHEKGEESPHPRDESSEKTRDESTSAHAASPKANVDTDPIPTNNDGVQRNPMEGPVNSSGDQSTVQRNGTHTEMCSRCRQRYQAGKPLDCKECEEALHRSSQSHANSFAVGNGLVQAKLEVSAPDSQSEREAERIADQVVRSDESNTTRQVSPKIQLSGNTGGTEGEELSTDREDQLRSSLNGGRPLDATTRSFFEPRFGYDFSDVRIHTGPDVDRAAQSIDAEAFTIGSDIAIRSDRYNPGTRSGDRLLAHELTHVAQQNSHTRSTAGARSERATRSSTVHRQDDTPPKLSPQKYEPAEGPCGWQVMQDERIEISWNRATTEEGFELQNAGSTHIKYTHRYVFDATKNPPDLDCQNKETISQWEATVDRNGELAGPVTKSTDINVRREEGRGSQSEFDLESTSNAKVKQLINAVQRHEKEGASPVIRQARENMEDPSAGETVLTSSALLVAAGNLARVSVTGIFAPEPSTSVLGVVGTGAATLLAGAGVVRGMIAFSEESDPEKLTITVFKRGDPRKDYGDDLISEYLGEL